MTYGRATRRRDEADLVILELVRSITVDPWTVELAVNRLLGKRHSRGALRLAQARVLRARAARASIMTDRAAETLASALSRMDQMSLSCAPAPIQ